MASIVILCYNKTNLSLRCIQAVLDAGYTTSQVSIIDNGSTPEFSETIRTSFPDVHIHHLEQNVGFAGGFTQGLQKHFESNPELDSVLFLTNDTQIHPGCLEACQNTSEQTNASLVAPCLMFRNDPSRIDSIGARFDRTNGTLHHLSDSKLPTRLTSDEYIPGTALWLTRNAFFKLGGTDQSYVMYWEDVDFCYRAHQQGLQLARCYEAKIQHGVGQTCHKKPIYTTFYYQRNRIRFCKQWLTPTEWNNVQPIIHHDLELLENRAKEKNDQRRLDYLHKIRSEEF